MKKTACIQFVVVLLLVFLLLTMLHQPSFLQTRTRQAEPVFSLNNALTSSATSGKLFSGQTKQEFPKHLIKFVQLASVSDIKISKVLDSSTLKSCEKWSVVTTIFEPSDSILKQATLEDWCMVIIGDKKSPSDFLISNPVAHVVYLNTQDQEQFASQWNPSGFISDIPWNHFGRKNIGYL